MNAAGLRLVAETAPARVPPHSSQAEQAVLGALLIDNDAFDRIRGAVTDADFYLHEHRLLFQHIVRLIESGKRADSLTVFEALRDAGAQDAPPGLAYLNSLSQNTPSAAAAHRYAEIVRNKAALRRLVAIGDDIVHCALQPDTRDPQQLVDELEAKVFAVAQRAGRAGDFAAVTDLLPDSLARIQRAHDGGNLGCCTTGLSDLDRMLGALEPGQLIIVGGRPSSGKTSLALRIAEHVAVGQGKAVGIFSMEMSSHELMTRLQGSIGGIDQQRLKSGALAPDDFRRLASAVSRLDGKPLFIDESPALSAFEVRARARRLARRHPGLALLVIDYLQLMTTRDDEKNRATALAEVSRALKSLAKELSVPVIALSQLNRNAEQRADKRPAMADLRESGSLEQDADVILLVHRESLYNPDSDDKDVAEVIVAKQRNGPVGTVRLRFNAPSTRFDSLVSAAG